jgi:3-phenylpropionate/trans-cinnamate dioxygenase ferredoxin reductase subunit
MLNTIAIAGGGHASGRAVRVLRDQGYDGRIIVLSDELHAPYERPPLSKEFLWGQASFDSCFVNPLETYEDGRTDLLLGTRVLSIDPGRKRIESTHGSIGYDKLLLATGARARPFPGVPMHHPRVHMLRNAGDALRLQPLLRPGTRVALIGGGFIGLEVAASARRLDCEVTVLESEPVTLARVTGKQVGRYVEAVHRSHDVNVRTNATVTRIDARDDGIDISCADGKGLRADVLVIGIGAVPNTEIAEQAGLICRDGIVVDSQGLTSAADIYATGDVTMHPNRHFDRMIRLETWENAEKQTAAVCRAMLGQDVHYDEIPWMWTDQFDVNLQILGLPVVADQAVVRGDPASGKFISLSLVDGRIRFAVLANMGRERRPLTALMASGARVSVADLANDAIALRDLARRTLPAAA